MRSLYHSRQSGQPISVRLRIVVDSSVVRDTDDSRRRGVLDSNLVVLNRNVVFPNSGF